MLTHAHTHTHTVCVCKMQARQRETGNIHKGSSRGRLSRDIFKSFQPDEIMALTDCKLFFLWRGLNYIGVMRERER